MNATSTERPAATGRRDLLEGLGFGPQALAALGIDVAEFEVNEPATVGQLRAAAAPDELAFGISVDRRLKLIPHRGVLDDDLMWHRPGAHQLPEGLPSALLTVLPSSTRAPSDDDERWTVCSACAWSDDGRLGLACDAALIHAAQDRLSCQLQTAADCSSPDERDARLVLTSVHTLWALTDLLEDCRLSGGEQVQMALCLIEQLRDAYAPFRTQMVVRFARWLDALVATFDRLEHRCVAAIPEVDGTRAACAFSSVPHSPHGRTGKFNKELLTRYRQASGSATVVIDEQLLRSDQAPVAVVLAATAEQFATAGGQLWLVVDERAVLAAELLVVADMVGHSVRTLGPAVDAQTLLTAVSLAGSADMGPQAAFNVACDLGSARRLRQPA